MDIYSTYYLLAAVQELPIEHTFFKQRYFPTNQAMDIFGTAKVLADYKEEGRKMAPFVLPRVGGVSVGRDGFSTYELEPANISVSMPLTEDQLKNRGFGESLMSNLTPEDRARQLQISDLAELDKRITRREEWLAIQTMLNNGCTMRHVTEQPGVYEDVTVKFYDEETNPALYKQEAGWEHSTKEADGTWKRGNWYNDIVKMLKTLTQHGRPATDLLLSSDVADFIITDPWVMEVLDNRRYEMGRIQPSELTEYVTYMGTLNFNGRLLDIISCDGTYEDETGKDVPYMDAGSVVITAPNCGRGLYGGVTQMETDEQFHTYAGTRVPQHIFTIKPPVKETQLTSKPLFVPTRKNPWAVAQKVFEASDP